LSLTSTAGLDSLTGYSDGLLGMTEEGYRQAVENQIIY
jgi:hypothetical protein